MQLQQELAGWPEGLREVGKNFATAPQTRPLQLNWKIPAMLSRSTFLNQSVFLQIVKWISPNCQMSFSKLPNVFLQIAIYISPNYLMYFSKLPNVFLQVTKCIYPNCQMYLSKLPSVFVQIVMAGSTT